MTLQAVGVFPDRAQSRSKCQNILTDKVLCPEYSEHTA